MEVILTPEAAADLDYWQDIDNKAIQAKISSLVAAIRQNPFKGLGKPEPLKNDLSGKWSRRIDKKHRLMYAVRDNTLYIYSLRDHYKKR
jgi:toxin YoeB